MFWVLYTKYIAKIKIKKYHRNLFMGNKSSPPPRGVPWVMLMDLFFYSVLFYFIFSKLKFEKSFIYLAKSGQIGGKMVIHGFSCV